MNRAQNVGAYLLFRGGTRVCALALSDVREVMRPLPVQRIAGAPVVVMGVAVIRGLPAPVIDAARLLADATDIPADRTTPTRFISLRLGARTGCLAVDKVLDVRLLAADQLHQTPPLLGASKSDVLPLIGCLDRELLTVLDTARLVPEAVWISMQADKRA